MNRGNPNRYVSNIIFTVCAIALFVLYGEVMYRYGVKTGVAVPKQCASVPGQQVVSTTAETCTYANSFGRATTKRRAG